MKTIWKFPLMAHETPLDMPAGARVLCAQIDEKTGHPAIWCEVEDTAAPTRRIARIIGTGSALLADGEYAGTYQQGPYVWHIYLGAP